MSANDKKQDVARELVINSIGAAIACDFKKEKNSSVIIAYSVGDKNEDVKFTAVRLPKKTMEREDFLSAIITAEGVRRATYVDYDGKDKDIYICRPRVGEVCDFAARDSVTNRYESGFAEIEASNLKFATEPITVKYGEVLDISVSYSAQGSDYQTSGLEFAIVNAYNACLLGRLFSREEFQLETGDFKRAKIEVRVLSAKFVDLSTLYIKPEILEGDNFVSAYVTEPVNVIDGDDMTAKVYRIEYRASYNGYYISRLN